MGIWKHTLGMWSLVAITAEIDVNLRKTAWKGAWRGGRFSRVEALAIAMSAIEICSRKKGKANRLSELEEVLLGYYIKLKPRSQESYVYLRIEQLRCGKWINRNFGIKSVLSQNWGHVFTPKFGKKNVGTWSFQNCANQGIDCIRIDISWFRCNTGIGSLWMKSANNDNELRLASGNPYWTLQKGKD